MSTVHISDVAVCGGTVRFALQGSWHAHLTMQGDDAAAIAGAVDLQLGETTLSGFATTGTDEGGLVTVDMIGGAGGLAAECAPQHYESATIRTIVTDALGVGGESLSTTGDSATLDTFVPMWTRLRSTVADVLWAICERFGAQWRVLPDGSVWVGTPTWATVEPEDAVLSDEDPTASMLTVAVEGADVLPGDTYLERRISGATYNIDDSSIRADLTYGEDRGGVAEVVGSLVASETAYLTYAIPFIAKILAQNGNGTLELLSGDARFPNMSKVPLRCMPGVTEMRVLPGTYVVVTHDSAQPDKPRASMVDLTACQSMKIEAVGGFEVVAAEVKAGGSQSLPIQSELLIWIAALTTAGVSVGLSVPAYAGPGTLITKGG